MSKHVISLAIKNSVTGDGNVVNLTNGYKALSAAVEKAQDNVYFTLLC